VDILDWVQAKRPGAIAKAPDRIEIAHTTGERSTIWIAQQSARHLCVGGGFYLRYDGADLFSSTFKIASSVRRERAGVPLVSSFDELLVESRHLGVEFPQGTRPFMYQSGIGYYAVDGNGCIHEWDTEIEGLTATFPSIIDVLDEWLAALDG
jgi:hypothetical protein